jgi:hypothetical protein
MSQQERWHLNTSIHALAARRAMNGSRIATKQNPAVAHPFCKPIMDVEARGLAVRDGVTPENGPSRPQDWPGFRISNAKQLRTRRLVEHSVCPFSQKTYYDIGSDLQKNQSSGENRAAKCERRSPCLYAFRKLRVYLLEQLDNKPNREKREQERNYDATY